MKSKYYMAEEQGDDLSILIYGDITPYPWDEKNTSGYSLAKTIEGSQAKRISVRINSYGGDVSEGLAIHNALKNHPAEVTTVCDGFACSAASIVFVAGAKRLMNPASLLMVHNAWSYASGNAADLRKAADDLEKISDTAAEAYRSVMTITEEELKALLDNEEWITPEEAVKYGFATGIIQEEDSAAPMQSAMGRIKEQLLGTREEKKPTGEQGEPKKPEQPSGFQKLFKNFK